MLAIRVTTVFFVLSLFCAPLLLTVVDVERWPATEAWAAMGTGAAAGCWLTGTGGKRRYSHLEAGTMTARDTAVIFPLHLVGLYSQSFLLHS